MSVSVNLVPTAWVEARARAGRRTAWLSVVAGAAIVVGAGWGLHRTATAALDRLGGELRGLETHRADAQRRLIAASAERTRLLERLRAVCAARRPQPWAHRLAALMRETPEGVFLTALTVNAPGAAPAAAARGPARRAAAAPRPEPAAARAAPGAQDVRLLGYALDHGALIQLLNTLQGRPGWQQVELVRATLEPLRGGSAVAFEVACVVQEDVR